MNIKDRLYFKLGYVYHCPISLKVYFYYLVALCLLIVRTKKEYALKATKTLTKKMMIHNDNNAPNFAIKLKAEIPVTEGDAPWRRDR